MYEQISLFDGENKFKINKPIRLIELFAGYGSQSLALDYLGVDYESWRICEWAVKSIQAYKDIHFTNDNVDYSYRLTFEEIVDFLTQKGISANYNEPMKREQIKRMGESKCRQVYNNIIATHNLVSVCNCHANDLKIHDTDQYCYVMTYSFPCQDLSNAGQRKGMEKGSGTRSGLLWEVERLLDECVELPQVLVMENVPEVIGTKNIEHFAKWLDKLETLGYKSKWKILNSKDFGVPQNRARCFMVSVLGDYYYEFPIGKKLDIKLKDLLEKNVDEKYYISDKMKQYITADNEKWTGNNTKSIINKTIASTINTAEGQRRCDASNFICNDLPENYNLKKELCNKLIQDNLVEEGDVIRHSYTHNRLDNGEKNMQRTESKEKLSPTLDTRCDCLGIVVKDETLPITKITENYIEWHKKGLLDSDTRAWRDDKISPTITTNGKTKIINLKTKNKRLQKLVNSMDITGNEPKILDTYNQKTKDIVHTITTRTNSANETFLYNDLRIRKLTPKECFRLMGVQDKDYEKVSKNQRNASLYHLAGDSIVVDVLKAIFKEML